MLSNFVYCGGFVEPCHSDSGGTSHETFGFRPGSVISETNWFRSLCSAVQLSQTAPLTCEQNRTEPLQRSGSSEQPCGVYVSNINAGASLTLASNKAAARDAPGLYSALL